MVGEHSNFKMSDNFPFNSSIQKLVPLQHYCYFFLHFIRVTYEKISKAKKQAIRPAISGWKIRLSFRA